MMRMRTRRNAIKDQQAEAQLFQRRALIVYAVILLVIGVLLARFGELMIVHHEEYAARSERNRVTLQPIPPTRGLILDRDRPMLAANRQAYRQEVGPASAGDTKRTASSASSRSKT